MVSAASSSVRPTRFLSSSHSPIVIRSSAWGHRRRKSPSGPGSRNELIELDRAQPDHRLALTSSGGKRGLRRRDQRSCMREQRLRRCGQRCLAPRAPKRDGRAEQSFERQKRLGHGRLRHAERPRRRADPAAIVHRDEHSAMSDFQIPAHAHPIGISDALIAVLAPRGKGSPSAPCFQTTPPFW